MGMLGGLGQGMQKYSQTLGKQREMNWEAQQAQLKYEREKNLTELQAKNQRRLQEDRIKAQESIADKKIEARVDLEEVKFNYKQRQSEYAAKLASDSKAIYKDASGRDITKAEWESMSEEERKATELYSPEAYATKVAVDRAEKLSKIKGEQAENKRNELADTYLDLVKSQQSGEIQPDQLLKAEIMRSGIPMEAIAGRTEYPPDAVMNTLVENFLANNAEDLSEMTATEQAALVKDYVSNLGRQVGGTNFKSSREIPQEIQDFINAEDQQEAAVGLMNSSAFRSYPQEWKDKIRAAAKGAEDPSETEDNREGMGIQIPEESPLRKGWDWVGGALRDLDKRVPRAKAYEGK